MRLATFNVENMFQRPAAMNLAEWADGADILKDYTTLNDLICKDKYTAAVKTKLLDIMNKYKGLVSKGESKYLILREVRNKLLRKPRGKAVEIAPAGRADWTGWFELTMESITERSTENTARVIDAMGADVLCVVEAEDRVALKRFNDGFLNAPGNGHYSEIMLIDGNDNRGIDVGILCRSGCHITGICSHVDDRDDTGVVFSRDCAEYTITTPKGENLLVMVNHLKSKGYGSPETSNRKRERQALRIREIYDQRRSEGLKYIAITGDFNDTPDSSTLAALQRDTSGLVDIMQHDRYESDGFNGTFGDGRDSDKFDYILMSPELAAKVVRGGIERRGVWGGKNGTRFPHFPEVTSKKDIASDHAGLWAEIDL